MSERERQGIAEPIGPIHLERILREINGVDGYYFNPGSDIDTTIFSINVTEKPILFWDESETALAIDFTDGVAQPKLILHDLDGDSVGGIGHIADDDFAVFMKATALVEHEGTIAARNLANNAYATMRANNFNCRSGNVMQSGASINALPSGDFAFSIKANDNGAGLVKIAEFFGAADPYVSIGRDDTGVAVNAVTDMLRLQAGAGTNNESAGFGFGLPIYLGNDASEVEERLSIDFVLITAVDGSEAARFDFNVMIGGAMAKSLSIKDTGIAIVEKAAASPDIADEGQFWVKNDTPNVPYFTDDAGTDKQLAVFDVDNGEMIVTSNQTAVIETANTPHAFTGFSTGDVNDFSFVGGTTGAITAYADYSGTVAGTVKATDVGHGLATGDIITIRGTTNYNGIFEITRIDDDEFYFTDTWVADDGASDWEMGGYLLAGTGTAGEYDLEWNSSVSEGGGAGSIVLFCPMINTTIQTKASAKRKFSNNDVGSISGGGHLAISVADRIWFTHQSDGTNDLTVNLMNLRLARLA